MRSTRGNSFSNSVSSFLPLLTCPDALTSRLHKHHETLQQGKHNLPTLTMTSNTGTGEPSYAAPSTSDRALPYYEPNISSRLSPELKDLLTTYSHFPASTLPSHVQSIRDSAWTIRTYPCIGLGAFLQAPLLPIHTFYPTLLNLLLTDPSAIFLEIGCFLGVDLRFLPRDLLYPSTISDSTIFPKLKAIDLIDFWPLGHKLFNSTPTNFPVEFIQADGLSPLTSPDLTALKGRASVINIAQVLHQFSYEGQVAACKTLASHYSYPPSSSRPGTVVIGNQIGNAEGRLTSMGTWQHGPDSWKEMWEMVGKETDTEWETDAELRTFEECRATYASTAWLGEGAGFLFFTCRRVA